MKKQLTDTEFYDAWLKYHGITSQWLIDNEPELIKTIEWYKKYAVTQEQYDEWYEASIQKIMKHYRWSRKTAVRESCFAFLNLAPSVKK